MFKRTTFINVTMMAATLLTAAVASAQFAEAQESLPVAGSNFGNLYSQVAPVPESQVQVVYYRLTNSVASKGAANVYVDREFHAALLPGGFSAFCVAPGQHILGAYVNDAPLYKGKTTDVFSAKLEGGKTYFLRVREDGNGAPQPVARTDAERELSGTHQQIQALSRASTVQACDYLPMAQQQAKDYALSGDVLFAFGKSDIGDITSAGCNAIRQLVTQLKAENSDLEQIEVVGHTDPIGSSSSNFDLGIKRAQAVRQVIVSAGLPGNTISASSAGSNQPLGNECSGTRAEQIACYAPDRRVMVRVHSGK